MKIGDKDEHGIEYSCPHINIMLKRLQFMQKIIAKCIQDVEKVRKINETLRNNLDKDDQEIIDRAKWHFGNKWTADSIDDCVKEKNELQKKVDDLEYKISQLEKEIDELNR